VHFRSNPDFVDHTQQLIPVWDDQPIPTIDGYTFVEDRDYKRVGFMKPI